MKKVYLCLLCVLLLLSGCGVQPPEPTEEILPTYSDDPLIATSAPDQLQQEQTEPTEVTVPAPVLDPVTKLRSIKWRSYPEFLSLGEGKVLACRNYFEEGAGIVNYLDILNVYDDALLCQSRNDSPRELVRQQFDDGCFLLRDPQKNTFYVYDQQLQIKDQFTAPNLDGYFSKDRQSYYFVENNVLYRMDVSSGNYGRMVLEYDLRFDGIIGVHPDRNVLVLNFYLSFYNENCGICAIDCDTGKVLLLQEGVSYLWFDGNTFYAAMTSDRHPGLDICYGDLEGGVLQRVSADFGGNIPAGHTMLSDSDIMLWSTAEEAEEQATVIYTLQNHGVSSRLEQYDYNHPTLNAIYLEQEQLIFALYPDGYDFSPVIIDPKALHYEKTLSIHKDTWPALVDKKLIQTYLAEVQGPELPDHLSDLRRQADALEQTYGIRILLGEQTLGPCGSVSAVESDPTLIGAALDTLSRSLARYPRGFLGQFRNGIREGGLYFCLTGDIQGNLDPAGKARRNGSRYELLLDISADGLDKTVYHEIWHATEMKLSTDLFATPQWQAINPEGYVYYGRYDSGYDKLNQWTFADSGTQCYFVDSYARINGREDRARLMETAMSGDPSGMLQSPVLREKLQIMSKAIRDHFDTTGWTTPLWEQ